MARRAKAIRSHEIPTRTSGSRRAPASIATTGEDWMQALDVMDGQEEAAIVAAEEAEEQAEVEATMAAQADPPRVAKTPRRPSRARIVAAAPPPSEQPIPQITTEMVSVDAAMAHQWLRHQNANRKLRPGRVSEFARDMLKRNWRVTGEALKFDPEGSLLDGQHRLAAVLEAAEVEPDISVLMLVVRGVPREAQDVMDTNSRRTGADQFKIKGYANYAALAAATKWSIVWERGALYADRDSRTVTHSDQLEFVQANPRLEEITALAAPKYKFIYMPLGFIITSWWVLDRIDDDQAQWFFDRLADGVNLPDLHPILALKNSLITLRMQKSNMPADVYMSMVMRTWNAVREGKTMQKMQIYKDGRPIKCPMPE